MPRGKNGQNGNGSVRKHSPLTTFVKNVADYSKDGQNGLSADWSLIDGATILKLVVAVTEAGGAVLFGKDSTKFGYVITIYSDGEKASKWFRPDDEGQQALYDFCDAVTESAESTVNRVEGA